MLERLLSKIIEGPGCWQWNGWHAHGYGYFHHDDGRDWRAPRAVYSLLVGPIPDGMLVCHHCDNPSCVRPDHLFCGTHSDNTRDCIAKGRWNNGWTKHRSS